MSKYTTQVRSICEYYANLKESANYIGVDEVLEKSYDKVFDFDFPIFDEKYRKAFEKKILLHYYTREIGLESVALWKLKLKTKLNEIMPYYNQLYKSELLDFNPFYNVSYDIKHNLNTSSTNDNSNNSTENEKFTREIQENKTTINENNEELKTTIKNESSGNATKNGSSKNERENLYSETPQGGIDGLKSNQYLTNATIENINQSNSENETNSNTENGTNNTISTENQNGEEEATTTETSERKKSYGNIANEKINSLEEYSENVLGKNSGDSFSKMLIEFRQTFLNIDMLVIEELEELFMQIW